MNFFFLMEIIIDPKIASRLITISHSVVLQNEHSYNDARRFCCLSVFSGVQYSSELGDCLH